jgi:hypothetical protein
MTIDDAIKQLKDEKKNGTKNIVFAYWDASSFDRTDDDDWAYLSQTVEDKMDWSIAHDQMTDLIMLADNE